MDGAAAEEKLSRLPTDYQATSEVTVRLLRELGCEDVEALYRRLHIDARKFVAARPLREHHPNDPQADVSGVRYRKVDYGSGAYDEPEYHPLARSE